MRADRKRPGIDVTVSLSTERISTELKGLGVPFPPELPAKVLDYISLLLRWNSKINLTSITQPEEILSRHFAESLIGARVAAIDAGELLDIGSGAGFPALPITMAFRKVRATLLEPNVKKAAFLAEVCRVVGLEDRVRILKVRLEGFTGDGGSFDFITSRAVHMNQDFLRKASRFLRYSGRLVLWVGQDGLQFLSEGEQWEWSDPVRLPGSERRFVVWGSKRVERST